MTAPRLSLALAATALTGACASPPAAPTPAAAPSPRQGADIVCMDRQALVAALARRHGERQRALGVTPGGAALELWAAPDGATWTLLLTVPGGLACLLAAGDDWMTTPATAPGEAS